MPDLSRRALLASAGAAAVTAALPSSKPPPFRGLIIDDPLAETLALSGMRRRPAAAATWAPFLRRSGELDRAFAGRIVSTLSLEATMEKAPHA